jgi:phospholipid/cholesterol/gamma-HCH transport system substrate-binding protein
MDERRMRVRVGFVTLAAILVTIILVFMIGGFPSLQGTYPLEVRFNEAPGVAKDTPVRKFGIRIGKVQRVGFSDDNVAAIVVVEIDNDVELRSDETFQIDRGVLGDAVLEVIDKNPAETPATTISKDEVLDGIVRPDPLDIVAKLEGGLADALASIATTSKDIGDLATRVNDVIGNNEEQVVRIVGKLETTIDRLSSAVASTDELLSDPVLKENLKRSIADLPEVLTDAREAIGGLKTALSGVDRNLANLEGFTRPLGERGGRLVASLESSINKLDQVMTDVSGFSAGLNNNQGSLGMLMNNPDVYQQLNEAAMRINQITKQLEPILSDARIFSDKLARHGLNSAFQRDIGTKRSPTELGLQYHPSRFPALLKHD